MRHGPQAGPVQVRGRLVLPAGRQGRPDRVQEIHAARRRRSARFDPALRRRRSPPGRLAGLPAGRASASHAPAPHILVEQDNAALATCRSNHAGTPYPFPARMRALPDRHLQSHNWSPNCAVPMQATPGLASSSHMDGHCRDQNEASQPRRALECGLVDHRRRGAAHRCACLEQCEAAVPAVHKIPEHLAVLLGRPVKGNTRVGQVVGCPACCMPALGQGPQRGRADTA